MKEYAFTPGVWLALESLLLSTKNMWEEHDLIGQFQKLLDSIKNRAKRGHRDMIPDAVISKLREFAVYRVRELDLEIEDTNIRSREVELLKERESLLRFIVETTHI